jgi:hypothetical protein
MKARIVCGSLAALTAALLFAQSQGGLAQLDDNGAVIAAHQNLHRKNGQTVTWGRRTAGQSTWFVKFAQSPCKEGDTFGHDRAKSCTIAVACAKAGDPGCKSYQYSSALTAGGPQHDPVIIVDP